MLDVTILSILIGSIVSVDGGVGRNYTVHFGCFCLVPQWKC